MTELTMPTTSWRITALPDQPGLSVILTVDTDAEPILYSIEQAARGAGVELERIEEAPDE